MWSKWGIDSSLSSRFPNLVNAANPYAMPEVAISWWDNYWLQLTLFRPSILSSARVRIDSPNDLLSKEARNDSWFCCFHPLILRANSPSSLWDECLPLALSDGMAKAPLWRGAVRPAWRLTADPLGECKLLEFIGFSLAKSKVKPSNQFSVQSHSLLR